MRIRIEIWSSTSDYSVFADNETNDFTIGFNVLKSNTTQFISEAYNIIKDWPKELINLDINDGIKYNIEYFDGANTQCWTGANSTPKNFRELVFLIEDYNPDTKDNLYIEEE
jgi:hypothetical protein